MSTEEVAKNARIVVVGAGISGIAGASKLYENGFKNVTILEAENRIGGRIHTAQFGNYDIDVGAQWVHGEEGNAVFELAWPLGLLEKSEKHLKSLDVIKCYDSLGNRLDGRLERELQRFYIERLFDYDESDYESVGEHLENEFDDQFKDSPEMLKDRKKYLQTFQLTILSEECADSWFDVSASPVVKQKECPGDQYINWKDRGYSTVLDILMKRYPNPEEDLQVLKNTIFNSEVVTINYSKCDEGCPILVTTKNEQIYKADHVIMTASLGVLKEKHASLFIPQLPDYKVKTIEGLPFGNIVKIFLLFKEPFWRLAKERVLEFSLMWNEVEKKLIENSEKRWLLGVESLTTVEHKPNLLIMWVVGKYGRLLEALPEEKILNHSVENLHRFLGKAYKINPPVAILTSRWFTNPNFRGAYSYRSVEMKKQGILAKDLEIPVSPKNLRILFAGEATSSDEYAMVHGAMISGWKAANKLINRYKKPNDEYHEFSTLLH